jgi:hypothetical protein
MARLLTGKNWNCPVCRHFLPASLAGACGLGARGAASIEPGPRSARGDVDENSY